MRPFVRCERSFGRALVGVYALRPRWRPLVPRLAERAREALAEVAS